MPKRFLGTEIQRPKLNGEDRLEEWPDLFGDLHKYLAIRRNNHEAGMRQGVMYAAARGTMLDRVFAVRKANLFEPNNYNKVIL